MTRVLELSQTGLKRSDVLLEDFGTAAMILVGIFTVFLAAETSTLAAHRMSTVTFLCKI